MENIYTGTDRSCHIRKLYLASADIAENTGYCNRCTAGEYSHLLRDITGNYRHAGSFEYIKCKFKDPGCDRTGNESSTEDFFCVTAKKICGCKTDALRGNPEPLYQRYRCDRIRVDRYFSTADFYIDEIVWRNGRIVCR